MVRKYPLSTNTSGSLWQGERISDGRLEEDEEARIIYKLPPCAVAHVQVCSSQIVTVLRVPKAKAAGKV